MKFKSSPFYSILKSKCPVCHEGDVFMSNKIINFKQFDKMHENCPVCNHKFEIEQGFFYGAMYTSYALTVAIAVAVFVITYLINNETAYYFYMINISVVMILLFPFTFRISRLMWMVMFSKYNPNIKKNK